MYELQTFFQRYGMFVLQASLSFVSGDWLAFESRGIVCKQFGCPSLARAQNHMIASFAG